MPNHHYRSYSLISCCKVDGTAVLEEIEHLRHWLPDSIKKMVQFDTLRSGPSEDIGPEYQRCETGFGCEKRKAVKERVTYEQQGDLSTYFFQLLLRQPHRT